MERAAGLVRGAAGVVFAASAIASHIVYARPCIFGA